MNTRARAMARVFVTVAVLCLGLMACSSESKPGDAKTPTPATAQSPPAQAQRYDLKGNVVAVDKTAKTLTVDHEAIPGFMGAMTMPYPVKDAHLLDNLSPGDHITAKVVSSAGEFWLEDITTVVAGTLAK